ncbi:hypothetical protein [Kineococcus terrestris]|uniref:hypothetical protein n=1 Tax=Kineococcus terrestris TaxID=2044856 RepID=UPI0034DAE76A
MSDLADRLEEFLRAPLAAAFFVVAGFDGLDADDLADPATASTVAATAVGELEPWTGEAARVRARAVEAVQDLRPLVRRVLGDERNAWWDAPLRREAQLHLRGRDDRAPDPLAVPVPRGPLSAWETYAQRGEHALITSTELPVPLDAPVRSGAHAVLAHGAGDWQPGYPVRQQRLRVAEHARVAEVHAPGDWHALVARCGDPATHPGSDPHLADSGEVDNGPAPTWSALAADLDGVHLSFAGLLSSLHVPVTSAEVGTTSLWSWEHEGTHWVRSVFTGVSELAALGQPPEVAEHASPRW